MTKHNKNLSKYRLYTRRASRVLKPIRSFLAYQLSPEGRAGLKLYFRRFLDLKNVRRVLGTNLALMFIVTSFMPVNASGFSELGEEPVITPSEAPLTTERVVQYPVQTIKISQSYKMFHPGIDLDGNTGDEIKPIKNGQVEAISRSKYNYGYAIIVDHGNGLTSLYAHLSKILVIEGQEVTTNTVIGRMGSTGRSTGDHLHLEVRDYERPINPYLVLPR